MDIIEFVEKMCNFQLTDFQKEFLTKSYESVKNNKRLYYISPRGSSRFSFEVLQALTVIVVAQERDLIKIRRNDTDSIYISTGKELLDSKITKFEVINGFWIGEVCIRNNRPHLNSFSFTNKTKFDMEIKPICPNVISKADVEELMKAGVIPNEQ